MLTITHACSYFPIGCLESFGGRSTCLESLGGRSTCLESFGGAAHAWKALVGAAHAWKLWRAQHMLEKLWRAQHMLGKLWQAQHMLGKLHECASCVCHLALKTLQTHAHEFAQTSDFNEQTACTHLLVSCNEMCAFPHPCSCRSRQRKRLRRKCGTQCRKLSEVLRRAQKE